MSQRSDQIIWTGDGQLGFALRVGDETTEPLQAKQVEFCSQHDPSVPFPRDYAVVTLTPEQAWNLANEIMRIPEIREKAFTIITELREVITGSKE